MSPPVERRCVGLVSALLCILSFCSLLVDARAQTIADYSRAQRALIENAMTQATARSAGLAASAPAASAPAPLTPQSPTASALLPHLSMDAAWPSVRVSGVFASAAGTLAEVAVNGTPYLLSAGQAVPGTAWRVEAAAVDHVVLGRREPDGSPGAPEPSRRVFMLPPLR